MLDDNRFTKYNEGNEQIRTLTDTAATLISCTEHIQEIIETIIRACNDIHDTNGSEYKNLLNATTEELKKLAVQYNTAAKQTLKIIHYILSQ